MMLKEYSIQDILDSSSQYIPYHAGTFEGTEDPDIEWPHRHSYFSLVWFTEGSGFYVIDFEEYEIKPDRIFLVGPKQIHNWDYSRDSKGYILMIGHPLGSELNLDYSFPFLDIKDQDKDLLNMVFPYLIESLLKEHDIETDIRYIYQIIERSAKQNEVRHYNPNSYIDHLKTLILEQYNKIQTIERYADNLHISADELNQLCLQTTGISTKQLILDIKITEAKRLLLYSNKNVNEIAFRLGFEDSSYFSRLFKKKTSLSPSDFLKKYRNQG